MFIKAINKIKEIIELIKKVKLHRKQRKGHNTKIAERDDKPKKDKLKEKEKKECRDDGCGDVAEDNVLEGLAFRKDLPEHLAGPHGFKKNGTLHGTHNQNNAISALSEKDATYELIPTNTGGISELNYKYYNEAKGKYVSGRKTVYDPSIYSNQKLLDMSQMAGQKAFKSYKAGNASKVYDIKENGVNFRAYGHL